MITIRRFEPKVFTKDTTVMAKNKQSAKIIDHKTDRVICVVNYGENTGETMKLAGKLVETIEEFIISKSEEDDI